MISRYWLSKTMKMGFLESSSSLQSPSLRDKWVAGGSSSSPSPLLWELLCSYLKLLLHQSCSRYATESTTMRRRQRLTFMMRSAEGSEGKKGVKPPGGSLCQPLPSPAWCLPELGRMFCSSRKSL